MMIAPSAMCMPINSVSIVEYVQSKSRAVHTMTQWFLDDTWAPVPGGLADHPDFWQTTQKEGAGGKKKGISAAVGTVNQT